MVCTTPCLFQDFYNIYSQVNTYKIVSQWNAVIFKNGESSLISLTSAPSPSSCFQQHKNFASTHWSNFRMLIYSLLFITATTFSFKGLQTQTYSLTCRLKHAETCTKTHKAFQEDRLKIYIFKILSFMPLIWVFKYFCI